MQTIFLIVPARFQNEKYKLNFLHYILNENENSLLYRFLDAQLKCPVRGDWVSEVQSLLKVLEIEENFDQIKSMKKQKFQKVVKSKMEKRAHAYLKKNIKTKVKGSKEEPSNNI